MPSPDTLPGSAARQAACEARGAVSLPGSSDYWDAIARRDDAYQRYLSACALYTKIERSLIAANQHVKETWNAYVDAQYAVGNASKTMRDDAEPVPAESIARL